MNNIRPMNIEEYEFMINGDPQENYVRGMMEAQDINYETAKSKGDELFEFMEKKVYDLGIKQIAFHVYANNTPAINLYKKRGYDTTNLVMRKKFQDKK